MVNRGSRRVIVGVGAAISLSVASLAPAQPAPATQSPVSPTAPIDPHSDAQIRSELRRLNTMKMECLTQARQALAGQKAASAGGHLSDAEAHAQILKDKMACADKANQDRLRLQIEVGPAKAALFASEDRFHHEYRQGLHSNLATLQGFSQHLANPDAITYEPFAQQMDTYRRQLDTFRNRYIRLLNEAETREFATTLFQASDLLIASARTWKQQVKAEAEMAEAASKGLSPQRSRAQGARDAAVEERASQWGAAQRLISQATALAAQE